MTNSRTRGPVTRVFLWTCGSMAAFVAAFWAVTATADLALSVGAYGTPGTYKVQNCYDTNHRRHRSDYDCYGYFTPDGANPDGAIYVHLKGTGHNYPDGTEFDARQGLEPETIQRVGFRGVAGELWQIGFATAILGWLAYLVIRPSKPGKPNRNREPSPREKAAGRVGVGVIVCVAVGVLGLVANFAELITS